MGDDELWTIPPQGPIAPPIREVIPPAPNAPPLSNARVTSVAGRTVTFDATATDADGVAAYEWSFGDLTRTNGASVTHTYLQDGYYQATSWVTDGIGNTTWRLVDVMVGAGAPPPVVGIEAVYPSAAVSGPTAGKLTVTSVGPSDGDLVVRYAVSGSGVNGVDYDTLSGAITLKSGFASESLLVRPRATGAGKTVRVTLLDDAAYATGAARDATVTMFATLPSPPAAPGGVHAGVGDARVVLSWNASAGATSYNLYRATTPGGTGATPFRRGITATTFVDSGLTNGLPYYYKLAAVNAVDESGRSAEVSAVPGGPAATPLGTTTRTAGSTPTAAPTPSLATPTALGATATAAATPTPAPACAASSTLRQIGPNGDYFRHIASDNSIRNSDRQRIRNTGPLTICAAAAYFWNAGPLNGSTLTTGTFHMEIWSDVGGVPGVQLGGDSTRIDAATLPAVQGQAPVQVVTWSDLPQPSGDFWLVMQSDTLSNDHLAWSAARYNPNAYLTGAYNAFKLDTDKGTDFTFTIYTMTAPAVATATPLVTRTATGDPPTVSATPTHIASPTRTRTPSPTPTRTRTPSPTTTRTPSPAPPTPTRTASPLPATGTPGPPIATATPGATCLPSTTLRQTGPNGDYFRHIASDNSIRNSDRQRIRNTGPLTICAASAYFWNAGPLNGSTLTTGTFHMEIWSDVGGVPGVQLGGDSTRIDAATLPAMQGQAPVQVVTWSDLPQPSGDFWLVMQSDTLSNDHLAWSAARYNSNAYLTSAYNAFKLDIDKGTDFTFTIFTR